MTISLDTAMGPLVARDASMALALLEIVQQAPAPSEEEISMDAVTWNHRVITLD